MELYQQMLLRGLEQGELEIRLTEDAREWLEGKCYQALKRIREVVADEGLADDECFLRVEQIILAL